MSLAASATPTTSAQRTLSSLLLLPLLCTMLLLAGCTTHQRYEPSTPTPQARMDRSNPAWIREVLYSQYDQWKNVKYKPGGLSRDGVDCSGFVYLTYDARLGLKLPRSTDEQSTLGTAVAPPELVAGDLVFFRTGRATRHVGIYLEDGKFLHASTEKGVMISRMSDPYWAKNYWKAVRLKS
jgi:cell wall-associated NlpC family hydrolase